MPQDIALNRSNFDAVQALAADEVTQFGQVAADAWQRARDYEQKTHTLEVTASQIEAEYDGKLRALCGSLPGDSAPALATCGAASGQIADLRAAVQAAGLRIRHAGQASENNLHSIVIEEDRFGRVIALALNLSEEIEDAQGRIFQVKDKYGEHRSTVQQAEAMAECGRVRSNSSAEKEALEAGCNSEMIAQMTAGPVILGVSTPNPMGLIFASKECEAKKDSLDKHTENQCLGVLGQAGLSGPRVSCFRSRPRRPSWRTAPP